MSKRLRLHDKEYEAFMTAMLEYSRKNDAFVEKRAGIVHNDKWARGGMETRERLIVFYSDDCAMGVATAMRASLPDLKCITCVSQLLLPRGASAPFLEDKSPVFERMKGVGVCRTRNWTEEHQYNLSNYYNLTSVFVTKDKGCVKDGAFLTHTILNDGTLEELKAKAKALNLKM